MNCCKIQRNNHFDSTNYLYIQGNNYQRKKEFNEIIILIQRIIYIFNEIIICIFNLITVQIFNEIIIYIFNEIIIFIQPNSH